MAHQPAVGHRRLTVRHGMCLVVRVGDHLQKRIRAGVGRDEGHVPAFLRRADQRNLRLTAPDDPASHTGKDG